MEPQRLANNRRALKPQENITDQIQPLPPPRKCPRCDSTNTKFCYYNNYSLSQPRYFCKGCRRYWTHGGTLRNVPVGGGCRKSKRPKTLSSLPASSSSTNEQITGIDIRSLATSYSPSTTTPAAPLFRSQSFTGLLSAGMHHHNMPNLYSSTTDGGGGLISSLGVGGLVMTACNNNMALLQGINYLQNMKPHQVMSTQRMINVPHQIGNDHHHQQFVGSQIIQQRPLGSWITTRGFVNSKNTGASETLITSTGL